MQDSAAFSEWIASRLKLDDPYSYAIVERSGQAVGIATLMEVRTAMRVIEVGHIVYSPALQRTPLGTEAQYLLARCAFETLGYRRYEWKCNALNEPSRRAALRLGFSFEGIFRQHMMPLPAVIHCTSPAAINPRLPRLSPCSTSPART